MSKKTPANIFFFGQKAKSDNFVEKMKKIWDSRKTYKNKELLEQELPTNPNNMFEKWLEEALETEKNEANAMIISTADSKNQPYSRVVLLREFNEEGFIFFTNYDSNKGQQIKENKKVSLLFFWQKLYRQVRILGKIRKVDYRISDKYFYSRPKEHQCGSIVSPQSKIINSKDELLANFKQCLNKDIVKRPKNWGGYIVSPNYFEFWQGQPNRLHDRIVYEKKDWEWIIYRIAP